MLSSTPPKVPGGSPLALRRRLVLWTALLAPAGCDGGTGLPAVSAVTVEAPASTLTWIGQTVPLTAVARDGGGVRSSTFEWRTSDPAVVTVSAEGVARAAGEGQATVTATVSGAAVSGSMTLTVAQEPATVQAEAADSVAAGDTLRLAVVVLDRGGTPLEGPAVTWSTSDETVATVDASGLLRGVEDGIVAIEGRAGMAADTLQLRVFRADLRLDGDATLSGEWRFDTLVVSRGATITASGDLVLDARFAKVAGTVVGDCVGLVLGSRGGLVLTGAVSNACSEARPDPPDLVLGGDRYRLDRAAVETSGHLVFTREPRARVDALLARRPAGPGPSRGLRVTGVEGAQAALVDDVIPDCFVRGAYGRSPAYAGRPGRSAEPGGAGMSTVFSCRQGILHLDAADLAAQSGGSGGEAQDSSADSAVAVGGDGGDGGDLVVEARLVVLVGGVVRLRSGAGGAGGFAHAVGLVGDVDPAVAAPAHAEAGDGGQPGVVRFEGAPRVTSWEGAFEIVQGNGGAGGTAVAEGAQGLDGIGKPAQIGGEAKAWGGDGGSLTLNGPPYVGDPALEVAVSVTEASGGEGGAATSRSGGGGDGGPGHPAGARGGDALAVGGSGGHAFLRDPIGGPKGRGGRGGYTRWIRGGGGDGFDGCAVDPHVPGGPGGPGGSSAGSDGASGVGDLYTPPPPGGEALVFGVGGRGGDGAPPGGGGPAGGKDIEVRGPLRSTGSWLPGEGGDPCGASVAIFEGPIRLGEDPAGHDAFVYGAGADGRIVAVRLTGPDAEGTITVEGAEGFEPSALPPLAGVLADGPFEMVGRGEIAGVADVTVTAVGTLSDGTLALELTVGAGGELPGGVPVTYRFEGTVP